MFIKKTKHLATVNGCSICEFETAQNSHLDRHIKSVHEGIKPFIWYICDVKFAEKGV